MYKVMHLFRSVMCELMWTNQTIIAVLVQSALQPFVSNDNSLLLNSDFYNLSNKAASHKSSCLAVKLLPSRDVNKNRSCMYILSVVDFWVCARIGKSDEVRHDETLASAELPQNQIWIDDVGRMHSWRIK